MTKSVVPSVAELPVRVGIRLVALSRLDEGLAARERLVSARDTEALHDFRVALRRLRSGLSAYRPWIEDSVGRQERHRLRDIARATGRSRDIEVQLHWLEHARLPDAAVGGARRLERRLRSMVRSSDKDALRAAHQFPSVAEELRASLLRYCDVIDPAAPFGTTACSAVAAGLVGAGMARLESHFEAMEAEADAQAAHQARIEVKRLRYLVEPFRDDVANGAVVLAVLRELQDGLGELHDLAVLLTEVEQTLADCDVNEVSGTDDSSGDQAALEHLARHIRDLVGSRLDAVRSAWLERAAGRLEREIAVFRKGLDGLGGYADFEIERKYLLSGLPGRRKNRTVVRIDQGWLPGERIQERIRRVRGEHGTTWLRSIKLGSGLVRREIEEALDEESFRKLWPLTRDRRISKRRYTFADNGQTWTVDRFVGMDLVLAEIELDSPTEEVHVPDWLARHIDEEVTGQAEYLNVNLARRAAGADVSSRA